MDKPSHWVTFLNDIFNPMAGFVHILPQNVLKQPSILCNVNTQLNLKYKLIELRSTRFLLVLCLYNLLHCVFWKPRQTLSWYHIFSPHILKKILVVEFSLLLTLFTVTLFTCGLFLDKKKKKTCLATHTKLVWVIKLWEKSVQELNRPSLPDVIPLLSLQELYLHLD